MEDEKTCVVIIDTHDLLKSHIESNAEFVVETYTSLDHSITRLIRPGVDIVLLEAGLKTRAGLNALIELQNRSIATPVIVFGTMKPEEIARAIKLGAQDCIEISEIEEISLERIIRYSIQRKRSAEALRKSEQRYALAARGADCGIWDYDLITGKVYYSDRWRQMIGYEPHAQDDGIETWFSRVHARDIDSLQSIVTDFALGRTQSLTHEYRIRHKDGTYRWMVCHGAAHTDVDGNIVRIAGSQTDAQDRKSQERQLERKTLYDPVTGLANFALFSSRVSSAIEKAAGKKEYSKSALLLANLDRFKMFNDAYSYKLGNRLLAAFAQRLRACLRPEDTVARLVDDEFAILLETSRREADAEIVAERIFEMLEKPVVLEDGQFYLSASIGIAFPEQNDETADSIIRKARIALYRAKRKPANQFELYSLSDRQFNLLGTKAANELRNGLNNDEFTSLFQPIFDLGADSVVGFETYVRWNSPSRGELVPADFIGQVEKHHLIQQLDSHMIRSACRTLADLHDHIPEECFISVNVSPLSLRTSRGVVDAVERDLTQFNINPARIHIDITEAAFTKYFDEALASIKRLRDMGVHVDLDDFGTGLSSLNHLHKFDLDGVKIDQTFISRLTGTGNGERIVHGIIDLAGELGLRAYAEGVETSEQADILRNLKCAFVQGYRYGKLLAVDDVASFLLSVPVQKQRKLPLW